jgi:hypothetical protein
MVLPVRVLTKICMLLDGMACGVGCAKSRGDGAVMTPLSSYVVLETYHEHLSTWESVEQPPSCSRIFVLRAGKAPEWPSTTRWTSGNFSLHVISPVYAPCHRSLHVSASSAPAPSNRVCYRCPRYDVVWRSSVDLDGGEMPEPPLLKRCYRPLILYVHRRSQPIITFFCKPECLTRRHVSACPVAWGRCLCLHLSQPSPGFAAKTNTFTAVAHGPSIMPSLGLTCRRIPSTLCAK